jgi:hypothetical protein
MADQATTVTLHLPVRYAAWFGDQELWERRVDWRADGGVVLELATMQVNPDEEARKLCGRLRQPWSTADGGTMDAVLTQGGWSEL